MVTEQSSSPGEPKSGVWFIEDDATEPRSSGVDVITLLAPDRGNRLALPPNRGVCMAGVVGDSVDVA